MTLNEVGINTRVHLVNLPVGLINTVLPLVGLRTSIFVNPSPATKVGCELEGNTPVRNCTSMATLLSPKDDQYCAKHNSIV